MRGGRKESQVEQHKGKGKDAIADGKEIVQVSRDVEIRRLINGAKKTSEIRAKVRKPLKDTRNLRRLIQGKKKGWEIFVKEQGKRR